MIARKIEKKIEAALQNFRIVMISGPRQSGKTTLVKKIATLKKMDYITLDEPSKQLLAADDPQNFIKFYAKKPLCIDEVQLSNELIPYIKMKVDSSNKKGQFLLTGSADISRMANITESLAGRVVEYNLYPLSNSEIKDKNYNIIDKLFSDDFFDIDWQTDFSDVLNSIIRGGYPEVIDMDQSFQDEWFASYIRARVQKDIFEFKNISLSKQKGVEKLLKLLATYASSILNFNSIAKKVQMDNKTVSSYIDVLEAMYIVKKLPPYFSNKSLSIIKSPKIHFIDTGLLSHLLKLNEKLLFEKKDSMYGNVIENFVYSELLKESTYSKEKVDIYHYRDIRKKEVDFVIENRQKQIITIEVKAKTSIKKDDLRTTLELSKKFEDKYLRGYIFYGGNEIMPISIEKKSFYLIPLSILS